MGRFVSIDHDTPMLLPPDMWDWVAEDHQVHFVIDAMDAVDTRLLCADTHPDHDTLCVFRRKDAALLSSAFAQVLELAANCGVLKVGAVTVAIEGTKVLANASKHSAVSHGQAEQKLRELDLEIAELMAKAKQADATPLQDGLTIPGELQRRAERKAKLARAKAEIEARAPARFVAEQADYAESIARREGAPSRK